MKNSDSNISFTVPRCSRSAVGTASRTEHPDHKPARPWTNQPIAPARRPPSAKTARRSPREPGGVPMARVGSEQQRTRYRPSARWRSATAVINPNRTRGGSECGVLIAPSPRATRDTKASNGMTAKSWASSTAKETCRVIGPQFLAIRQQLPSQRPWRTWPASIRQAGAGPGSGAAKTQKQRQSPAGDHQLARPKPSTSPRIRHSFAGCNSKPITNSRKTTPAR